MIARQNPPAALSTGDLHDFDFLAGTWAVANRRLKVRGVGSGNWDEFPATNRCALHLGGVVNVEEIEFPTQGWTGMTVRTFDVARRRWSIYWLDSRSGTLQPPVFGGFQGDRGEFHGDDEDDGHPVKVVFVWTKLGPGHARWEQSFSADGGQTWEKNWTMEMTRIAG